MGAGDDVETSLGGVEKVTVLVVEASGADLEVLVFKDPDDIADFEAGVVFEATAFASIALEAGASTTTFLFFLRRFSADSSFFFTSGGGAPIGRNLPIFFALSSFSMSSAEGGGGSDEVVGALVLVASRLRLRSAIRSSRERRGFVDAAASGVATGGEAVAGGPDGNGSPENAASRAASASASSTAATRALFCSSKAKSSPIWLREVSIRNY